MKRHEREREREYHQQGYCMHLRSVLRLDNTWITEWQQTLSGENGQLKSPKQFVYRGNRQYILFTMCSIYKSLNQAVFI